MEPQVIYRRWRPRTLSEVVGQEAVTTTLRNAVRTNRVGHAYLFSGPRGTGKTSTGRILAKAVNCTAPVQGEPCDACDACVSIARGESLDIIEIDAASNRGVDDIRMLRERVGYAAASLRRKVYIIDEVHMLTDVASNALLKTLEEPPPHVMFILATTEIHKVLPTIVSRCQSFTFRRLAFGAVVLKLKRVCEAEAIEAPEESLALIARAAGGSLRDAENLLQQLVSSHGSVLQPSDVREALGVVEETSVLHLAESIVSRDLAGGLRRLHEAIDGGVDARHIGRQIVESLHDMVLIKSGCGELVEAGQEHVAALQRLSESLSLEDLGRATKQFSGAIAGEASRQLLALELAFVDWSTQPAGAGGAPPAEREAARPARAAARSTPRASATRSASRPPVAGPTVPSGAQVGGIGPQSDAGAAAPPRGAAEAVGQAAASVVPADRPSGPVAPADVPASQTPSGQGQVPTEPAQVQPAAAVAQEPATELDRVRVRWKEFVASLRGSPGNLDALLRSACEPTALEDGVLVLRFAYDLHRSKVQEPKCQQIVEEQLQRFYDRPYRISCLLEGAAGPAAPSPAAPASASAPASAPAPAARAGRLVDAVAARGGRVVRRGAAPLQEGGDDRR